MLTTRSITTLSNIIDKRGPFHHPSLFNSLHGAFLVSTWCWLHQLHWLDLVSHVERVRLVTSTISPAATLLYTRVRLAFLDDTCRDLQWRRLFSLSLQRCIRVTIRL